MSQEFKDSREDGVIEKRKFWQPHIDVWEHSGVSQSEYCREKGLSIKRFGYWKRKLCSKNTEAISFVPVAIKKTYPVSINAGASLRLVIDNGYNIDIGDGFNSDTLRRLLDTLGQRV